MSRDKDTIKKIRKSDKKEISTNDELKNLNTTNLAEFVQTVPTGKIGRENYANSEKSDEFTPL